MSGERVGKVLDELAAELSIAGFTETSVDGYGVYPDEKKLREVLEERLGPLLRAGQAMRDQLSAILGVDDRAITNGDTLKILDEWQDRSEFVRDALKRHDAALAALERERTT